MICAAQPLWLVRHSSQSDGGSACDFVAAYPNSLLFHDYEARDCESLFSIYRTFLAKYTCILMSLSIDDMHELEQKPFKKNPG
jgi:hypothetical protein